MDKNTLAGFGLLMLLLIGYIFYNQPNAAELKEREAKRVADSVSVAKSKLPVRTDTSMLAAAPGNDSLRIIPETLHTIENKNLQITFTNKGGYPVKAMLKNFTTFDGKPLYLFDGKRNMMDFGYRSTQGTMLHTRELSLSPVVSADKRSISFTSPDFSISYTLLDTGYMVDVLAIPHTATPSQPISLDWSAQSLLTELDIESQKLYTQVCYKLDKDGYDYYTIDEPESNLWQQDLNWLSFKQHYFNTTFIPETKLVSETKVDSKPTIDTNSRTLSECKASMRLAGTEKLRFQFFYGPNDYALLKSYKKDLQEIIPLSYGIFGFVKYINTWLILPIFNSLSNFFSSYGIVILLLTFIIRLLMSPFTYKSYVSSAKMKALKPEMDELREKYGDDKQTFGLEQMKLYRQAGVNPLGGCLPALLQLPVFFALLSFFPHAIELRQEKFLWADDLSTYDSILNLPFSIPFYGDHVSLFTILFVITSLVLALYSMNMTVQDQNNPMMKYLPFIMPVMFLGIFNKLPAALTYYYFVSNVITLGLQFVIQNYIINPDKIHAQIQAKRNEPPKENKLMAKMMEMQKQQQQIKKK
jgi:YidC/Oxa1 family membrane protein insertase